jgi:hypothetical protein
MKKPLPLNSKASRKRLGTKTGAGAVLALRQEQAKEAKSKDRQHSKPGPKQRG